MPPAQVLPRPFILGIVLMLLVLSMQSDWNTPGPRMQGNIVKSAPRTGQLSDGVPEKLIYELSLDNERLEQQNKQLKQYVLDVRRAAKKCECDLDDKILTLYPELYFGMVNDSASSQIGGHTTDQQQREQEVEHSDDTHLIDRGSGSAAVNLGAEGSGARDSSSDSSSQGAALASSEQLQQDASADAQADASGSGSQGTSARRI